MALWASEEPLALDTAKIQQLRWLVQSITEIQSFFATMERTREHTRHHACRQVHRNVLQPSSQPPASPLSPQISPPLACLPGLLHIGHRPTTRMEE